MINTDLTAIGTLTNLGLSNDVEITASTPAGGAVTSLKTYTIAKAGTYLVGWTTRTRGTSDNNAVDDTIIMRPVSSGLQCAALMTDGIGMMTNTLTTSAGILCWVKTTVDNAQFEIGVQHWNGLYRIQGGTAHSVRIK